MTRFWSVFGFYLELRPYELEIHEFDISYQICWVLKLFILYTTHWTKYERWDASIYFEKSDFVWNSSFQKWLPSFFLHKICCVKTSQRPNVDYKAIKIFLHFAYSCNFTIFMINRYTFWKYYNNLCRNHEIYSHEENFLKQIHLSKTKFDQISSIESLFPFYNKFFCMTFTLFKIYW